METLLEIPWTVTILACLTLGLAPFSPPHVVEKLKMLKAGELKRPLDWFDLFMHSSPWAVLVAKAVVAVVILF